MNHGVDCKCNRCSLPPEPESEYEGENPFIYELDQQLAIMRARLIEKNRKYGDAALDPIRLMSRCSPSEAILVRMDDKLSRIKNRQNDEDEDPLDDFAGYYFLLKIQRAREAKNKD